MATITGRVLDAQIEIMKKAGERWIARQAEREAGLRQIARGGLGAADTMKRQLEFAQRARMAAIKPLALNTTEAIIRSNDLVRFAPSEISRAAARPVARIVTLGGERYEPQGVATGFLIAETGLLVTNYHVFQSASDTRGYGANFRYEEDEHGVNAGDYFELDADRFFVSSSELDFAIVAVKPQGLRGAELSSLGFVRFIEATGKVLTGEPLNIIEHPGGGPRRYAIKNNQLLDILPQGYLHYEGDTERGSSGSPVMSTRWELVALHHSAVPAMEAGVPQTNRGTPFDPNHDSLADIKWVANEGIRVSFIADALRHVQLARADQQILLQQFIESTSDPLGPANARESLGATRPDGSVVIDSSRSATMGPIFNISGATTIHVYGGTGVADIPDAPARPVAELQVAEVAAEAALVFDPDYPARSGYDPKYLGKSVPLPTVDSARIGELYTVGDYKAYFDAYRDVPEIDVSGLRAEDPFILDYHHYSLCFNKKFFMCMWTASNCDYRDLQRQDTRRRSALGGENWRHDPRVPAVLQLLDKDIYTPARRIDRGHIVRREDNCWGEAGLSTDYANSDTYHFTNCTPQHEAFNQENPGDKRKVREFDYSALNVHGIWGQFEAAVEKQLESAGGVATIFAGPMLRDFFETRDWGTGDVRIPKKFWKVVVVPEGRGRDAKLFTYGYVFDQSDVSKRFGVTYEERLELPAFERKRKTLAEITAQSGVDFDRALLDSEQALPG